MTWIYDRRYDFFNVIAVNRRALKDFLTAKFCSLSANRCYCGTKLFDTFDVLMKNVYAIEKMEDEMSFFIWCMFCLFFWANNETDCH